MAVEHRALPSLDISPPMQLIGSCPRFSDFKELWQAIQENWGSLQDQDVQLEFGKLCAFALPSSYLGMLGHHFGLRYRFSKQRSTESGTGLPGTLRKHYTVSAHWGCIWHRLCCYGLPLSFIVAWILLLTKIKAAYF